MGGVSVSEPIKGYRVLTPAEIKQINAVKDLAERTGDYIDGVEEVLSVDRRWLAIAKTQLQQGFSPDAGHRATHNVLTVTR